MKFSLGIPFVVSLLMLSCAAKEAPSIVSVKVADTYSGPLHLRPCVQGASEPVSVDDRGNGELSACPSGEIEIAVLRQTKTIRIAPEHVKILKTGDGIPTSISAQVP
jgi:hypothetical protein